MNLYRLSKVFIVTFSSLLLMACFPASIKPDDPKYAPVLPEPKSIYKPTNGSLFQEHQGMSLFGNTNNHRIGDIITITLDEKTISSKSTGVDIDKESDVSLLEGGNSTILGHDTANNFPLVGRMTIPLSARQDRSFSGDASADQSNSLQGNISVTVVDILTNGNLIVRGEKWMTLNRGEEYIRVSGMLPKDDVSLDNVVSSTKLANARISYSGTGDLANSQQMGWLGKFFNSIIWPF
jgi:flagellar L-ring protein precursor FlgH